MKKVILVALAIVFCGIIFVFPLSCVREKKAELLGKEYYLELTLTGEYQEKPPIFPFEMPLSLGGKKLGFNELILRLNRARYDSKVKGVIVKLKAPVISLSRIYELKNVLRKVRESGKDVVLYMEDGGMKEIYLASVCSRVYLNPSGSIDLIGFRIEPIFFKGTMKKLGVSFDVIQLKEYKDAFEPFVNETLTSASREVYNSILDFLYNRFISEVSRDRGLSAESLKVAIDEGLLLPAQTIRFGLVDSVLYESALDSLFKEKGIDVVDIVNYTRHPLKQSKDKIGILYAFGAIRTGKSSPSPYGGSSLGSHTFIENLKDAVENKSVKAIVVRVNSPGGSSLASDIIWNSIREARKKKPVVVSMGDLAASGGYYISMAADSILATPFTLTGSIGVIFAKPNLKGFYDKLGINRQTLARGKRTEIFSDYRSLSPEEKEFLYSYLKTIYDDFVRKASESRNLGVDSLEKLARGRVWIGGQAREIGLVDIEGGFLDAIELAARIAGIPLTEEPGLVYFPKKKGLMEFLLEISDISSFVPQHAREIIYISEQFEHFKPEEPLALFPCFVEIK